MTQPYYIRKETAAELLETTVRTVNRWISSGQLDQFDMPGRGRRVKYEDVVNLPKRSSRATP